MRRLTRSAIASGAGTMNVPETLPRTYRRLRVHPRGEDSASAEHVFFRERIKTEGPQSDGQLCLELSDSEPLMVDFKMEDVKGEVASVAEPLEDTASGPSTPEQGFPPLATHRAAAAAAIINSREFPMSNRASTSGVCSGEPEPAPSRPKRRKTTSYVWEHFVVDNRDRFVVVCNRCRVRVRLGKEGGCGRVGTSAMHKHLQIHHPFLVLPKKSGAAAASGMASVEKSPRNAMPTLHPPSLQCVHNASTPSRLTVDEPLERSRYLSLYDPLALQYNEFLAEYLAEGMLPYSTVEEPSFLRMLKHLRPGWQVPGRAYFSTCAIPALVAAIKATLQRDLELSVDPVVHLTASLWTSGETKDYMTVTAHWVTDAASTLVRRHAALLARGFEDSHTAEGISRELKAVVGEWLDPLHREAGCVACDGGAAVERAVADSGLPPIPCVARCLDLIVEGVLGKVGPEVEETLEKARNVRRHLKRFPKTLRSPSEIQALQDHPQGQMGRDEAEPVGWNATLALLQHLSKHQCTIDNSLIDNRELCLTPGDWRLIRDVVQLLQVFEEAVNVILRSDNATLGHVLPLLHVIEGYIKDFLHHAGLQGDEGMTAAHLASDLLQAMSDSRHLREVKGNVLYQAASFLDPRFKDSMAKFLAGDADRQIEAVKEHVVQLTTAEVCLKNLPLDESAGVTAGCQLMDEVPLTPVPPARSTSSQSSPETSSIWAKWCVRLGLTKAPLPGTQGNSSPPDAMLVAREEVVAYTRDYVDHIGADMDPLAYWQRKRNAWPSLFLVALRYAACPPTGICSKRLFSAAMPDLSANLARLPLNTAEVLSFIRMNRRWIPQGFTAPAPTSEHSMANTQHSEDEMEKEEEHLLNKVIFDE